jgi:hypothetical protein
MRQLELTRRSMIGLLGAVFASPSAGRSIAGSRSRLQDVVRRNTLARGGAAALDRVRTTALDVQIFDSGMTLTGRYAANVEGLVRMDVYSSGKLVGSEGIDADGVWILGPEGPRPSVATGAANALKHGAEDRLFGWHRFEERGHKLRLMPPIILSGVPHEVVEIRYSTGHTSFFYVDTSTWQATRRRDQRAYHPDVDSSSRRVETRMSDFEAVSHVMAAHRTEDFDLDSGSLLSINRVLSRRVNPRLPSDYFARQRRASETWPAGGIAP